MDQLVAMRVFLAVADQGSFSGAARAMRLSAAAATRAVAQCESDTGATLLNRTTRSVALTEKGAIFAERCRTILADVDQTFGQLKGDAARPGGRLSLTAPVMFGRLHILPIVEALAVEHPGLTIRMTFVDRVVHLVEEGFDLAVRIGPLADSALIAVPIARTRRIVVAAPSYLAERGVPDRPADLKHHRIVSFEGVGSTNEWRFGRDGRTGVTVSPQMSVNTAEAAIDSAVRGMGVTRVLSYQVAQHLGEGRLKRLLIEEEPADLPVHLVFPAHQRGLPNLSAFLSAARRYFSRQAWD